MPQYISGDRGDLHRPLYSI